MLQRPDVSLTAVRNNWLRDNSQQACPNAVEFDMEKVQGSAKRWSPGLVNFIPAVAYHFCLALPAAFMQPGAYLLAEPCIRLTVTLSDMSCGTSMHSASIGMMTMTHEFCFACCHCSFIPFQYTEKERGCNLQVRISWKSDDDCNQRNPLDRVI